MMKMNKNFADTVQFFLETLVLDTLSAAWLLYNDTKVGRQYAVEFIYRIFICELVVMYPADILIKHNEYSYDGIKGFCQALADNHPYDGESVVWIGSEIGLSEKGMRFLSQHNPSAFEQYPNCPLSKLNIHFIEALEKTFEEHGLAWDDEHPLFPIKGK